MKKLIKKECDDKKLKISVFFLRLIPAYILVLAFFFMTGPYYAKVLLPGFRLILGHLHTNYKLIDISSMHENGKEVIAFDVLVSGKIKGLNLPLEDKQRSSINTSILYGPPIIALSLLLAWPLLSLRQKLQAGMITLFLLVVLAFVDVPVSLIYSAEKLFGHKTGGIVMEYSLSEDIIRFLCHFFNNGGRQFMALLVFAVTVMPFYTSDTKLTLSKVNNRGNRSSKSNRKE